MISGLYAITHRESGKQYIGSTNNFLLRWREHRSELRHGCHCNQLLQRAWDKYGEEKFSFDVIMICGVDNLLDWEQRFLDGFRPAYNIALKVSSPMKGRKHTLDSRKKMSEAHKGYVKSPEHCARISIANTGKKASFATKQKMSLSRTGKKASPDGIAKMVATNRGKTHSPERVAAMRKGRWPLTITQEAE